MTKNYNLTNKFMLEAYKRHLGIDRHIPVASPEQLAGLHYALTLRNEDDRYLPQKEYIKTCASFLNMDEKAWMEDMGGLMQSDLGTKAEDYIKSAKTLAFPHMDAGEKLGL